jgi:hypothetical protein
MPDLLGPCPCGKCACYHGAFCTNGNLIGVGECPRYAAYHARRELLEALKAGGVYWKHPDEPDGPTLPSFEDLGNFLRQVKVGWMVFIPEAQE